MIWPRSIPRRAGRLDAHREKTRRRQRAAGVARLREAGPSDVALLGLGAYLLAGDRLTPEQRLEIKAALFGVVIAEQIRRYFPGAEIEAVPPGRCTGQNCRALALPGEDLCGPCRREFYGEALH